jgi:hypothetical protein
MGLSNEMPGVGTDIRPVTTFGKCRLGLKPGSERSRGRTVPRRGWILA